MLDVDKILPKDPDELRQFTAFLLAEVKSQAVLIEKLRHQLAGQHHHRSDRHLRASNSFNWRWKRAEIAVAEMTAKLRLPDEEPKDKPIASPYPGSQFRAWKSS